MTNDDAATISISDATIDEGGNLVFTVTMTNESDAAVSFDYATVVGTAGASDFTADSDTVTFAPGETTKTITIATTEDLIVENDETMTVVLSALNVNGRAVTIADNTGEGTITNDDKALLSISDVTQVEGSGGSLNSFTFTVTSDKVASEDITVLVSNLGVTATGGTDFTNISNQPVTIVAGTTSAIVNVTIGADDIVEDDETFQMNLTNAKFGGATDATRVEIDDAQGIGTILNDDLATITISDPTVVEGDAGTVNLMYEVSLSHASQEPITVDFATADGSGTAGVDYVAQSGTVTFAPTAKTAWITVVVNGDNLDEQPGETVLVNLSGAKYKGAADPTRVIIGDAQGIGTITDDDYTPVAHAGGPYTIDEGDSLTLNGSASSDADVVPADTLIYTWTVNGVAQAPTTANTLTLTWAELSAIGVNDDGTYNASVHVSDGTNSDASATTTITVENVAPALGAVAITNVNENGTATLSGTITDPGTQDTFTLVVDWGDGSGAQTYTYAAGTTTFSETHQYLDDNPTGSAADNYSVNLTLTDDDGGQDLGNATVTVTNVAPTLGAVTMTNVDENGTSTLTGTITDPGTQDTFTLVVDWGDGSPLETFTYLAGTTTFSETHQYLDDNPTGSNQDDYTVTLTLTDDDSGVGLGSSTVTVTNVDPVVTGLTVTPSADENGIVTVSGTVTDPGTLDTFTLTIDWDKVNGTEGAAQVIALGATDINAGGVSWNATTREFSVTHQYLDDNPTGTASDGYDIDVTLVDDDFEEEAKTLFAITDSDNVAQDLAYGNASLTPADSAFLNTQRGSILHDSWTQVASAGGGELFTIEWQFADIKTVEQRMVNAVNVGEAVTWTVTSAAHGTQVYSGTWRFSTGAGNLATRFAGSGGNFSWDDGVWGAGNGLVNADLGTSPSGVEGNIQWGHGNFDSSDGSDKLYQNGVVSAVPADFKNLLYVNSSSTAFNATLSTTINNVAPTVTLTPPAAINEDGTATLSGTITDVGTLDTFTLDLNWGDPLSPSNTQSFTLGTMALTEGTDGINWNPTTREFSLTHQYLDDNPTATPSDVYTISATVTDDDTGTGANTTTVTVNNVDPDITSGPVIEVIAEANAPLSTSGTFAVTDPGTLDVVSATVDPTVGVSGVDGGLTQGELFAMLTVNTTPVITSGATSGTINWSFDSSSSSENFDFLAVGEALQLTYTVIATDDDGGSDTQTVTITIIGTNDAPTANPDTGAIDEDSLLSVPANGVLSNDTDPDLSDILTVSASDTLSSLGATVVVNSDGSYTYDPRTTAALQMLVEGETVTDTFTYTVTDSNGGFDTATVTITVTGKGNVEINATDILPDGTQLGAGAGPIALSTNGSNELEVHVNGALVKTTTPAAIAANGPHDIVIVGDTNDVVDINTGGIGAGVFDNLIISAATVNLDATVETISDQTYNAAVVVSDDSTIDARDVFFNNPVDLGANHLIIDVTSPTTTIAQVISGVGGSLEKAGTGTITLTEANTYTGGTTITEGTLQIGANGTTGDIEGNVLNNATLVFARSDDFTFDGDISGSGDLRQAGDGAANGNFGSEQLTLSGTNSYSGVTTIDESSEIVVTNNGSLGTSRVVLDGTDAGLILGAEGLNIGNALETATQPSGVNFARLHIELGAAFAAGTYSGAITIKAPNAFDFQIRPQSGILTLSGPIDGAGWITQQDPGTVILSNSANTYSGGTYIANTSSILRTEHSNALGAGDVVIARGILELKDQVNVGNSIQIEENQEGRSEVRVEAGTGNTTATVSGDIAINESEPGDFRLDASAGDTLIINGVISGVGASGLTKTGDGTVVLNNDNTYSAFTNVSAGTLEVNGNSATATGAVSVASGATLGGEGVTGGAVSVASGGTLSPDLTAPGDLGTGDLSLESGATYTVQIDGLAPMTGYDQVDVTGSVNLNSDGGVGATLDLSLGFNPDISGTTFTIIENDDIDADTITTEFDGFPEGHVFNLTSSANGEVYVFQITYAGGTGNNDVVLTSFGQAETSVELVGGDLVITDINNDSDDALTITEDATHYIISDAALALTTSQSAPEFVCVDGKTIKVLKTAVKGLVVNTENTEAAPADTNSEEVTLGALTFDGSITVNSNDIILNGSLTADDGGTPQNITLNGAVAVSTSLTLTGEDIEVTGRTTSANGRIFTIDTEGTSSLQEMDLGTVVKEGSGSLALTGPGDNSGLAAIVNAGLLILDKPSAASVHAIGGGGLTINNGATVQLAGTGGDQLYFGGLVRVNAGGVLDLNGRDEQVNIIAALAGTITNNSGTASSLSFDEALNQNFTVDGTDDITLDGAITSTAERTLTKEGVNTLTLTGNQGNTFLILDVNAGDVELDKSANYAVAGISDIASGSTVMLTGTSGDQIFGGSTSGNQGRVSISLGGTLDLNGNSESWSRLGGSGAVTNDLAATTATATIGESGGTSGFFGTITDGAGTLALTKIGAGTFVVSGGNGDNTYTGLTTVSAGALEVGQGGAGGFTNNGAIQGDILITGGEFKPQESEIIADTSKLTVQSGGLFNLNYKVESIANIVGDGSIRLNGTLTLVGLDGSDFSGDISGPDGNLVIDSAGAGDVQILSGANTYGRKTTVSSGTLLINGTHDGGENYLIASDGTVGGDGTITLKAGNSLTIQDDGVLATGDAGIGELTVNGGPINLNGDLQYEISGATSDKLTTNGNITLNNGTSVLEVTDTVDSIDGTTYFVINNTGANAVTNIFAGKPEGATVTDEEGDKYTISYVGGDGNDVVLFAGAAETNVDLSGGNLTVTDINMDSDDNIAIEIVTVSGVDYYQISDSTAGRVLSTTNLGGADVLRPNASTVLVRVGAVTGNVTIDTTGPTPGVEAADSVLITSMPASVNGNVTIISSGIQLDGGITATGDITLTGDSALGNPISLTATDVIFNGDLDLGAHDLTLDVTGTASGSSSDVIGSGGITKLGTGTVTLTGTGITFEGGLDIDAGRFVLEDATGFATGNDPAMTLDVASGAFLEFEVTGANEHRMAATGLPGVTLSGTGTIEKTGTGTLALGGGGNTFLVNIAMGSGGLIDVQEGTLRNGPWKGQDWSANLADLNVDAGATLDVWDGNSVRVDALSGAGTITRGTPNTGSSTLIIGVDNGTGDFTGVIGRTATAFITLQKEGMGTQTLSGSGNNTDLTATVNDGVLVLAKASGAAVHALEGTGTILTINNGGTVQLAGSGNDQIDDRAQVTVNTGGVLDLDGNSEGFDKLTGSGQVESTGAAVLTIGTNNGGSTFNGKLTEALTLEKTGTGEFQITNVTNDYAGGTTILDGRLKASDRTLGAAALTLDGGTLMNVGAGGGGSYFDADLGRQVIVGANGGSLRAGWAAMTVSGQITSNTGSGALTIANDAPVIFTNTTNNYVGNTIIGEAGSGSTATLTIGANGVIPDGAGKGIVIFNGVSNAILNVNGFDETINGVRHDAGSAFIESKTGNGKLTIGANDVSSDFSGVIRDNGGTLALTKIGTGTVTLSGALANTYTGQTVVSEGILELKKTAGVDAIAGDATGGTIDILVDGGTLLNSAANQIADTVSITLDESTWDLDGNDETVNNVAGINATAASGFVFDGATLTLNRIDWDKAAPAVSGPISDGTGTFRFVAVGGVDPVFETNHHGTLSVNDAIQMDAATLTFRASTYGTTLNGKVSGTGKMVFDPSGSGGLTLSNGANDYSGGTVWVSNSGTGGTWDLFTVTASGALGTGDVYLQGGNQISTSVSGGSTQSAFIFKGNTTHSNNFFLTGDATISIDNPNSSLVDGDSVDLTGQINLQGNTLFVRGPEIGTISGAITGAGGVTKIDSRGTWILSGTNSYTGVTTVNDGTLQLDGTHTGGGTYTVTDDGVLSGTGSTESALVIDVDGDISPGVGGTGTLSIEGGIILRGEFLFDVNGASSDTISVVEDSATAGFNGDLSTVTLDENESILTVMGTPPAAGSTILLIDNGGNDAIIGRFKDYLEGDVVTVGTDQYVISYVGGDGNDVVLFAGQPETNVAIDGAGNLLVTDINSDSSDDLTVSIVNIGGENYYQIEDSAFAQVISTTGIDSSNVIRPAANVVQIKVSAVTGTFTIDTVNGADAGIDTVTIGGSGDPVITLPGALTITAETINLNTGITTIDDITLNGTTEVETSLALTADDLYLNGATNLDANTLTVDLTGVDGEATGIISGTGGLIKQGGGLFHLNAQMDYTGATDVVAGTLLVGANGVTNAESNITIRTGAILELVEIAGNFIADTADVHIETGGLFRIPKSETIGGLSGAGDVEMTSTSNRDLLVGGGNETTTFTGTISDGATPGMLNLSKVGTGELTLGGANTFRGTTDVDAGKLILDAVDALGSTSQITIAFGATLQENGVAGSLIGDTTNVIVLGGGTFALDKNEVIGGLSGAGIVTASDVDNSNGNTQSWTLTVGGGNATSTFSGTLQDDPGDVKLALTKIGTGVLTLNSDNTFTGATFVNGGRLVLAAANALGSTTSITIRNGATLEENQVAGSLIGDATDVTVEGGGSFLIDKNENIGALFGAGTISTFEAPGGSDQTASDEWYIGVTGGNFTGVLKDGVDSAALTLNKRGTDTLILSGINTYTGKTNISGGTLDLNGGEIGNGGPADTVTVSNGATLTGNGTVYARVSGAAGSSIITDGDLTLGDIGGDGFTTAGTIIVNAGDTLTLNDSNLAQLGAVTLVKAGATLTAPNDLEISSGGALFGGGDVNADVNVLDGNVSPGEAGVDDTQTLNTDSIDFGTGTYTIDLDGVANGDLLQVTGTVTIGNGVADLDIVSAANLGGLTGQTIVIIDNDDPAAGPLDMVSGTFAGMPEGHAFTVGGQTYVISYNGGTGNDVVLFVGEPETQVELTAGGVLNITDITNDTVDTLTVTYNAVTNTYTIQEADGALVISTLGLTTAQVTRPDAQTVVIDANAIPGGVKGLNLDTSGPDTSNVGVETNDAVTILTPNGALVIDGDVSITADDITVGDGATASAIDTSSGAGSVTFNAKQQIDIRETSQIIAGSGSVTLNANTANGAVGGAQGIDIFSDAAIVTGSGDITINGRGSGNADNKVGVRIRSGASVTSNSGSIDIDGVGSGNGDANRGVFSQAGTIISTAGNITIDGTGGGGAGGTTNDMGNDGVELMGLIETFGAGLIAITGTGGGESANSSNNNNGVQLSGGSGIVRSSGSGTITITGTGGDANGGNRGVNIAEGNRIESTTGNILVTGQGGSNQNRDSTNSNTGILMNGIIESLGTATITLDGDGGGALGTNNDLNNGVEMASATAEIKSVDGAITITGDGGGAGSSTGDDNDGVVISDGSKITSTGAATITITGTTRPGSDAGVDAVIDDGVEITGMNTMISSASGKITITGTGENGVDLSDQAEIWATGSAEIEICGHAVNPNALTGEVGTQIASGIFSNTGNVTIESDDHVSFGASGSVTSVSGTVTISADKATLGNGGQLLMMDGALVDAGSGTIDVNADGDVSLGGLKTTGLVTIDTANGSIVDGGDTDKEVIAGSLLLNAPNGTVGSTLNALETQVANLEGTSLGNFAINNMGALNIGGVDATATGLSVGGNLMINNDAAITDSEVSDVEGTATLTTKTDDADILLDFLDVKGAIAVNTNNAPASDIAIVNAQTINFENSSAGGNFSAIANSGDINIAAGITVKAVNGDAAVSAENDFSLLVGGIFTAVNGRIDITVDQVGAADGTGGIVNLLGTVDTANEVFIYGGGEGDIFNIQPSLNTEMNIEGNNPATILGGDFINLVGAIDPLFRPTSPTPTNGAGFYTFGGGQMRIDFIEIEADNVAPDIDVVGTDSDNEGLTETDSPLSVTGTLTVFDLGTVGASIEGYVGIAGSPDSLTEADFLAMFSLTSTNPIIENTATVGTINWRFDSNTTTFDFLALTETLTLTYTIRATDPDTGSDTQTVTITITGTNDDPVLTTDIVTVFEGGEGGSETVSGNALANDTDIDINGQGIDDVLKVVNVRFDGTPFGGSTNPGGAVVEGSVRSVDGLYGTLSIDANGNFIYTVDGNLPTTRALSTGDVGVENFIYMVSDGSGGFVEESIVVRIVGATGGKIGDFFGVGGGGILEGFRFSEPRDGDGEGDGGPLLLLMPTYSGVAEAGSVVKVTVMGPDGSIMLGGSMTVVADQSGGWIAKFSGLDIGGTSYLVKVETTTPAWSGGMTTSSNVFFAPAISGAPTETEVLTVDSVMGRRLSSVGLDSMIGSSANPNASNADWRKSSGMPE
ncbi:autotransporter-associated beta strand repeat-containing protein [Verrucomicrobiales bacterium BCK34]|nr:autotransporter-associated beta strand repeat-containing protein [Verrucomicrobiales bacterium BCK34]